MTQQLPIELYRWLSVHQVIDSIRPIFKPSGKCEIQSTVANQFSNGIRIAKLIVAIATQKGITMDVSSMESLKNSSTPASKLHNWNILSEALEKIGFNLTKIVQKDILTGNFNVLIDFLIRIMKKTSTSTNVSKTERNSVNDRSGQKSPRKLISYKDINIDKLNPAKPIDSASTFLEFIILAACQTLSLPPKQVLGLLTDGCSYFAHLLVKGVKGSYIHLLEYLDKFRLLLKKFVELMQKSMQKNFELTLQLLKPGLLSKSEEIVKKTIQLLISIFELIKANKGIDWFFKQLCRQGTLFETIYLSLRRHNNMASNLNNFIFCVNTNNINDFYLVYFRKSITSDAEYLKTILLLLDSLASERDRKKQLIDSGVITGWLKLCENVSAGNDNNDVLVFSTQLMCKLCIQFPQVTDEVDESLETLLAILKKHSRSESRILKTLAINHLFEMLQYTARSRNRYAPVLYKKMIFLYLENHQDANTREVILLSFNQVFEEFPTIPVDLIVQPFIRQLQLAEGSTYLLNIFDLAFLKQLVNHPKLSVKGACMLAEFLMKLYVKNLVFSKMLFKIISVLCERFCETDDYHDAILKQSKEYLTTYLTLSQKRGGKGQDGTILSGQKRSLIIEMIKLCIQLEQVSLNDKLKIIIGQTYTNLMDTKKYNDKGLFALLSIFGTPQALVEEIRSKQQNEFKETEVVSEYVSSPIRVDHAILKRNYTNPKHMKPVNSDPFVLDQQSLLRRHNIGYKAHRSPAMNKAINRSVGHIKPVDEKVQNGIQKIKLKFIQKKNKVEMLKLQQEKRHIWNREAAKSEILQKNISLGFVKVGDSASSKMLYEFNTVREASLPSHLNLIQLEQQEDRDQKSVEVILKRQARIIKLLFTSFSNASRRMGSEGDGSFTNYISFTDTVKLLKDWNMGKLPSKVIVSEIMKQINSGIKKDRNVLIGVDEEHFQELLVQFTAVLDVYDPQTKSVTQPLGIKLDRLIKGISQGEIQKFDDQEEAKVNATYDISGEVPKGYKKVIEQTIWMNSDVVVDLPQSYIICIEIVDEMLRKTFGTGPIEEYINIAEQPRVRKIQQKIKPRNIENTNEVRRNKSQEKLMMAKEKQSTEKDQQKTPPLREKAKFDPKKVEELMKIRLQRQEEILRRKKQKQDAKLKEKQQQLQKEKRKQQQRRKQAEQRKYLLQQHKKRKQQQQGQKEREKKEQEAEQLQRKKQEREQFFRKQKNRLHEQFQQKRMQVKEGMASDEKRKESESLKKSILAKKMNDIIAQDKRTKEKEAEFNKAVRDLLQNSEVSAQFMKYDSELKAIFKHYSELGEFKIHRSIKTLDMKGYSMFVKEYSINPELYKMPDCLKIYKYIMREGNINEGLNYDQFLEILVRLAAKSDKLLSKNYKYPEEALGVNEFDQGNNGYPQQTQIKQLGPQIVERLFGYMKLDTHRSSK